MSRDSLGDRIKGYEDSYRHYLPNRMPIIIRIDGKGWHQYTRGCQTPFDFKLIDCLNETAIHLCKNIQGAKLAYLQSDEINILVYNPNFETQGWFDNNFSKIISVSAAMASAHFTSISHKVFSQPKLAYFDARAFVVPVDEVVNVFEWRQQDATRNSVQMLARSLYSHKECNNKNISELQELCWQKGQNWNNLATYLKRGRCIVKSYSEKDAFNPKTQETIKAVRAEWIVDKEIPIFHRDKTYISKYLSVTPKDAKWSLEPDEMGF